MLEFSLGLRAARNNGRERYSPCNPIDSLAPDALWIACAA